MTFDKLVISYSPTALFKITIDGKMEAVGMNRDETIGAVAAAIFGPIQGLPPYMKRLEHQNAEDIQLSKDHKP